MIMGGSGSGKSTLLRHLIGLNEPAGGRDLLRRARASRRRAERGERMLRRFGVLYQSGALWSSMTLAQNVAPAARRVHRSRARPRSARSPR